MPAHDLDQEPTNDHAQGDGQAILAGVLPIALELFVVEGADALTLERLHEETGVSRGTMFNAWPRQSDLIGALLSMAPARPPGIELTHDLALDLHKAMELLVDGFNTQPVRAFFAGCLACGIPSEEVSSIAEDYAATLLQPFHDILAEAVERGEVDGDVEHLVDELTGPLLVRHVIRGKSVVVADGKRAIEAFLARPRS